MKTLRYMGHAMGLLLRSAMQYRASFLMQTLSQAVMTGGELLAVEVLLGRFTRLGPWSGPEILFFFGVMQCVFALGQFLGRGVENFSAYVHSGEFDTMLARPRALFVQVICARLDPRRLGGILVGLCALALAAAGQPIAWSWGKALLLLVSCLGSALLLLGLAVGCALSAGRDLGLLLGAAAGLLAGVLCLRLCEKRLAGRADWAPRVDAVYSHKPDQTEIGCGA